MHRHPDWDTRLAAYLESIRLRAFEWGGHDCCLFAAGAVLAMTGDDPMAEVRGRYSTAIGAARALTRIGAGSLAATMDAKFERVGPLLAHRGDIVMTSGLLAICLGLHLVAVGAEGEHEGLIRLDRDPALETAAWRVPY